MSFLRKILKTNTHNRDREKKIEEKQVESQKGDTKTKSRPKNLSSPRKSKPSTQSVGAVAAAASTGSSPSSSPAGSPRHPSSPRHPTTYEVRSSTNKHVAQVLPGLLLGSQEFAQDLSGLKRYQVSHILNITGEVVNSFPERFVYQRVAVTDMPHIKLEQFFTDAFEFINSARSNGGCVLVHCYYGASRSASIVIGYLMKTERMRYREALAYLQMIRPEVYPNDGFEKQLREYEHKIMCTPLTTTTTNNR